MKRGNQKFPLFFSQKVVKTKDMSAGVENILRELVNSKFTEDAETFPNFYLVDLTVAANKKVEVFIDSDTGINFDHCRMVSRYLEAFIDQEGWFGEKYTLEVSSPGVDRPLEMVRQYRKNIGRLVKVTPIEGKVTKGTLTTVEDDHFVISFVEKVKEGKKNKKVTVEQSFTYEEVKSTVVKISF